MASGNLDVVRSIFAAWARGEYTSAEWAHPEIEFVFAGDDILDLGTWRGLTGLADGWRGFLDAWEEFRVTGDEYKELDGGRVLVLVHFTGRGKTSGLEVERIWKHGANLFHVRNSKVTRLVLYSDRERAFADLGLS